ncbi:MAG: hypothetical protein DRI73_09945 [Bacteroidetes bacterium]|nr:MAG: hypothetical protein DRI73_09945 [Bacteroidota bacterium]
MPAKKNTIYLKGKVSGILDQKKGSDLLRILCKPEWLVIHIENSHKVRLNDQIIVRGSFSIEEIHQVDMELNGKLIKAKV